MVGLGFLFALILLIWIFFWLGEVLIGLIPLVGWFGRVAKCLIVCLLFLLLVVDELVGYYQYQDLCRTQSLHDLDLSVLAGKKISIKLDYRNSHAIPDGWIPLRSVDAQIVNAISGEVELQFKDYLADGGLLARLTPIKLGGSGPVLFDGAGCDKTGINSMVSSGSVSLIW